MARVSGSTCVYMIMCVQRRVSRRTRVRALAWGWGRGVCAPPRGRPPPAAAAAQWPCAARVYPARTRPATLPSGPRARECVSGARMHAAPGPRVLLVLGSQTAPSRPAFSVFPGLPPLPTRSAPGAGSESSPARPAGEGGGAAERAPPLPCRARPGAPMGFSMTASGRGPSLFPPSAAVPASWPASPLRAGVFPGLKWSMEEPPPRPRPSSGPAGPCDPRRTAPSVPFPPPRLAAPEPVFVRQVDCHPA